MRHFLRTIIILTVALTYALLQPQQALHALPLDQKGLMQANVRWFDVRENIPCDETGGFLDIPNGTVDENGKAIFDFLVTVAGFEPYQAAGIIGNMMVESGLEPQRKQGTAPGTITTAEEFKASGSGSGWGLVQWTPGMKFIGAVDPIAEANNLGTQLSFLWEQLQGLGPLPEGQAGEEVKGTPNLEEAVIAFQGNMNGAASPLGLHYFGYERPKDQTGSVPERTAYANSALLKYGSGGTTPTTPLIGSDCSGGNPGVVGGMTLPVAPTWYLSNPEWFTKPHHDYPAADIPVPTGTEVYSMTAGTITRAPIHSASTGYGLGVWIDAGNGIEFIYGHGLDGGGVPGAGVGDVVKPGQLIMHSDNTGHSFGAHLHLEIRVDGVKIVCPQSLFVAIAELKPLPDIKNLPTTGCTN